MTFTLIGNQAGQQLYDDHVVLTGAIGVFLGSRCVKDVNNLVVNAGLNLIVQRLRDNLTAIPSHIAVGTDSTVPNAGQTVLGAEVARQALAGTAVVSANTIQFTANFAPGVGTGALIEAGLFNAGSGGTMVCRTLFSGVVTKAAGDTLGIIWTLTVS